MESNIKTISTEESNDGSHDEDKSHITAEDEDSKMEIEIQVETTDVDNAEEEIEDGPLTIVETVDVQSRDETDSTDEKLEEVVKNETTFDKEKELKEQDENFSEVRNNTDIANEEQEVHEIHSTKENIENIADEEQEIHSTVENIKNKEQEIHSTKEDIENIADEVQNIPEIHSTKENIGSIKEIAETDSTEENGITKALKRPFEESEGESSSEESEDEGSGFEINSESDEDSNKVPKLVMVKESQSKKCPSKRRKIECTPMKINFNDNYNDPDFMKTLSSAFSDKTKIKFENGASILSEPFTCCVLPNFIDSEEFIKKVKEEVEEIEVEAKMNDLYKFKQSVDLADYPSSEIQAIYDLLHEKCVKWLSEITNIPLINKIDMFCSCYTYTDHLLCHDDELEGRRIAYIYYLTPPNWEKKDGGLLDLFDTVEGEPSKIVHSFVPTCNNFLFFEVGPTSYHQVSEVLAFKTRTALSGWFYGPPLERNTHSLELVLFKSPSQCTVDIRDWINPIYLKPDTQLHIRGSFEESSEMELMDFFQNAKYEMVCQALNEKGVSWKQIGPPNRRHYEKFTYDSYIPPILTECQDLFCCEQFLLVLSNLTGLRFHPLCDEADVKMGEVNSTIRKWSHGSYSLLHEDSFFKFATLNAALCFNCPDWEAECGGYTSYVAKNKKDELLRVDPKPNSLALVYITKKTSFFVKYVNSHVTERSIPYFQDIFSTYREIE